MNKIILTTVTIAATCAAQAFSLVENGKAKPVVIPANAAESTKLAACEWTNYVFRATGSRGGDVDRGLASAPL